MSILDLSSKHIQRSWRRVQREGALKPRRSDEPAPAGDGGEGDADDEDEGEGQQPKKRRGGGGRWRAFQNEEANSGNIRTREEMMAAYRALDETERRRLDEVGKAAAQAHRLDGPSFSVDKYARKRLRRQRGEVGAELRQLELALKQDISEKDAVDLKPSTSMALPSSGDWDSNLKAVITGVREDNKRDRQFEEIVGNELATYSAKESSTRDAADKFAYDDVGKVSGESASLPVPDLGVQGQCVFRHIE
eukprot:3453190-Pyramimonas_sp.AAC.1